MLPHLTNGWQVDQAILSEEDRVSLHSIITLMLSIFMLSIFFKYFESETCFYIWFSRRDSCRNHKQQQLTLDPRPTCTCVAMVLASETINYNATSLCMFFCSSYHVLQLIHVQITSSHFFCVCASLDVFALTLAPPAHTHTRPYEPSPDVFMLCMLAMA